DSFFKYAILFGKDYRWFFDISRIFNENRETIYCDSFHYTDKGNYIIAKGISDKILPYVEKKILK
ncbi:MAG: hypothetical protein ABIB11_00825, partial [Candidatus Omnitrophota bacterium]